MTTPKDDKPVYIPATLESVASGVLAIRKAIDKPNEAMRELAKEFRRLAAEAQRRSEQHVQHANQSGALSAMGKATVWREAAQMLEEKLNG